MADSNQKQKALTFIDSIMKHDRARMRAVCHADFIWTLVPKSLNIPTSGGDAAIDMLSSLGNTAFRSGSLSAAASRVCENANTVVLEVNVKGTTIKDRQYDNWYVLWFEFRDGLIAEFREHVDTKYAVDVLMS